MSASMTVLTFAVLAGAMLARPAELVGQDAPPPSTPDVQVLAGHPDQPGRLLLRITFPPGFHTDPHRHGVELTARVRRGRLMMGWGSAFDTTRVVAFEPGSSTVIPAARDHYDWFPEGAEVDYESQGPWQTVLVDTAGKPLPSP